MDYIIIVLGASSETKKNHDFCKSGRESQNGANFTFVAPKSVSVYKHDITMTSYLDAGAVSVCPHHGETIARLELASHGKCNNRREVVDDKILQQQKGRNS